MSHRGGKTKRRTGNNRGDFYQERGGTRKQVTLNAGKQRSMGRGGNSKIYWENQMTNVKKRKDRHLLTQGVERTQYATKGIGGLEDGNKGVRRNARQRGKK